MIALGIILLATVVSAMAGATSDASKKLDELLLDYDPRVRPYADSKPVEVVLQISLLDIGPINEKEFTFHTDMYLRHWWKDPRLQLGVGNITFNGDPTFLWIPDTFIKNSQSILMHSSTTKTIRTVVSNDGSIYMSSRMSAICTCDMDLRAYPMDNQTCGMALESYAFSDKDFSLKWHKKPVEFDKKVMPVEGYVITGIEHSSELVRYVIGDNFQILKISFKIDRTFSYYIYRSYIPSTFLVIMTWGSFWLPITTYPARTGLVVTNFLASAFILQGASSQITKVPYTTAIEIYLLVNIIFILATMLEYVTVIQMSMRGKWCRKTIYSDKEDTPKKYEVNKVNESEVSNLYEVHLIDRISRYIFPIVYCLFITVYFAIYLNYS